jgi:hypothetical protein
MFDYRRRRRNNGIRNNDICDGSVWRWLFVLMWLAQDHWCLRINLPPGDDCVRPSENHSDEQALHPHPRLISAS